MKLSGFVSPLHLEQGKSRTFVLLTIYVKYFKIHLMKIWRFAITKTPRPLKPDVVAGLSTMLDEKLADVWEAIATLREDISGAKRIATKTERAVYRKAAQFEPPGENGPDFLTPQPQPGPRQYRTGDSIEVR